MEQDFQLALDTLVIWANDKGYHVHFEKNGDDCICRISKIIEINSSAPLEKQVYCLLHECGHVLIFDNKSFWNFHKKYVASQSSDTFKVFTVIEEIEAWKRGFSLANRLNISIDKDKWESEMQDAIKKYIKWAAK